MRNFVFNDNKKEWHYLKEHKKTTGKLKHFIFLRIVLKLLLFKMLRLDQNRAIKTGTSLKMGV